MKAVFVISAVFAACLALLALYSAVYFGWLTATRLTDAQLKRAQYDCYAWFLIFVATSIGSVALVVFSIRRGKGDR
jgi:hypothetical protein